MVTAAFATAGFGVYKCESTIGHRGESLMNAFLHMASMMHSLLSSISTG